MKNITTLLFAATLAFAGASAAKAFTFESNAAGDGSVHQNYIDPDDQMQPKAGAPQRFGSGGDSDSQKGGFSVQFGGVGQTQSFDQKYNSDRYFNPNQQR